MASSYPKWMNPEERIDPKFAEVLEVSKVAYEAEKDGRYKDAIDAHAAAADKLSAFSKKSGFFSFLSLEKRRLKRQIETKIGLHHERIKELQLAVSNEKPSKEPVPAVTARSVSRLLGASDGSAKSLHEAAVAASSNEAAALSLQEILHPLQDNLNAESTTKASFAQTLPPDAPIETWIVRRHGNTAAALESGYVFTVKDATETHTLYILEAQIMKSILVPFGRLSRAGEYPYQAALVKVWPALPPMNSFETKMYQKGRPMKIEHGLLREGIFEEPDVREESPWGPRRFVYGGRRFVWKPKTDKGYEDGNFETLYEYRMRWPRWGAKVGVFDDDADGPPLCWCDPVPGFMIEFKWTIHFIGGLDPLFKEHLIGSQLGKMAAMHGNMKDAF